MNVNDFFNSGPITTDNKVTISIDTESCFKIFILVLAILFAWMVIQHVSK